MGGGRPGHPVWAVFTGLATLALAAVGFLPAYLLLDWAVSGRALGWVLGLIALAGTVALLVSGGLVAARLAEGSPAGATGVVFITLGVAALLGVCAIGVGTLAVTGADTMPAMIGFGVAAAVVLVGGSIVASIVARRRPAAPSSDLPYRRAAAAQSHSRRVSPPDPAVFVPCPGCGRTVSREVSRCPYCQTQVEGLSPATAYALAASGSCPRCGKPIDREMIRCPGCHRNLWGGR